MTGHVYLSVCILPNAASLMVPILGKRFYMANYIIRRDDGMSDEHLCLYDRYALHRCRGLEQHLALNDVTLNASPAFSRTSASSSKADLKLSRIFAPFEVMTNRAVPCKCMSLLSHTGH